MTIRDDSLRLSRRGFLAAGGGRTRCHRIGRMVPPGPRPPVRIVGRDAARTPPAVPPRGIALFQQAYQNWSKEIMLDAVWTCTPTSADDVVRLANWAHANGYTIRPRGAMHGWTPLTVVNGASVDRVILADTMTHLAGGVSVQPGGDPAT